MSEKSNPSPNLSEQDVITWLKAHPNFLKDNPDMVDILHPPKQNGGKGVVDFQSYLIERLKADKTEAIETARGIVETARHNMNNQTRIHAAVLRLLEAPNFETFIDSLTGDLTALLDVDITTLVVESDGDKIPQIATAGLRIVPEGTLGKWLAGKPILHQSDIGGVEAIYGAGASLVRSQVLLKIDIGPGAPPAILAFGSRDPNQFQPGQGTEQITFLARVIERLFRSWLGDTTE
ncbi:MAG TPA: DUF484 family protein [Alphaproteobacteria bacterium]|nr:DUF484 family protein [Alphaproteobacteria bacterium]HNS43864.1 DUF484 family protein [Alphaproteobacteria bacterium]